jgi:Animal haem peroxidase
MTPVRPLTCFNMQDHQLDHNSLQDFSEGERYGCPMARFKLKRSRDYTKPNEQASVYLNTRTGWWDASFVYGQTLEDVAHARERKGGRLRLPDNSLPIDAAGLCSIGDQHNSWLGVACLQVCYHLHNE